MSKQTQHQGKRHADAALVSHALRIPDESAWRGYENDQDVRNLYEMLFSPRRVFQYYVRAFASFVLSPAAAGDSDSASAFLSLIEEREKYDPGSVQNIIHSLDNALTFAANNQSYFDAPVETSIATLAKEYSASMHCAALNPSFDRISPDKPRRTGEFRHLPFNQASTHP